MYVCLSVYPTPCSGGIKEGGRLPPVRGSAPLPRDMPPVRGKMPFLTNFRIFAPLRNAFCPLNAPYKNEKKNKWTNE